ALARAESGDYSSTMFLWDNLLLWNKSLGAQRFDLTLLQSAQQDRSETKNISVKDLPYESQLWYNLGSAPSINGVESAFVKWQLASYMGRINYTLSDRYLFTASARYDGSSRLAAGQKWVLFPSGAFAWRLSEEPFFNSSTLINDLKLRLGFGVTGNAAIPPYRTGGNLAFNRYNFGDSYVMGFYQNEMPNA